jgi:serine/threonine protein kinase
MSAADLSLLDRFRASGLVDQYRLLECIGRGGQSVVWSALDTPNNRVVAMKLSMMDTGDPAAESYTFWQEAQIIASLEHPHILPLYDFGVTGTLRYLVTPYIPAGSLKDLLSTRSLSYEEVLHLAAEIVSALAYIHRRNIVHRDLKPTNILLGFRRHVYLADFELARALSSTTTPLHTGRGTPPYSSPEQIAAAEMTVRSDIYSLGIILFEMFTGSLPWNGEKALGIEQLGEPGKVLPAPRKTASLLPLGLVDVLHAMTAADPANRPTSATEALRLARTAVLRDGGDDLRDIGKADEQDGVLPFDSTHPAQLEEARVLLNRGMAERDLKKNVFEMSLTDFVFVDTACGTVPDAGLPMDAAHRRFMLHGALTYGHRADFWWRQVTEARQRLEICAAVIENGSEAATEFAVEQMLDDVMIGAWDLKLPASTVTRLLDIAHGTSKSQLGRQILVLLRHLLDSPPSWQTAGFGATGDARLAELALTDRPQAVEAARLIGHVRSEAAVEVILGEADDSRMAAALTVVQQTAGSFPRLVPLSIRWRLESQSLLSQLAADWPSLLSAYLVTLLGSFLGFGLYVYTVYRLPRFWDSKRLLVSLERGLFLGLPVGSGIFLTRLIVRRLTRWSAIRRLVVGVIIGAGVMSFGLYGYHTLFLDNLPTGWPIGVGCLVVSFGFALGVEAARARGLQMLISLIVIGLALGVSWGLHVSRSMDPMLYYDYAWSARQIVVAILLTTLPVAVSGNLFDLSYAPKGDTSPRR